MANPTDAAIAAISSSLSSAPRVNGGLSYGTAGFRSDASRLRGALVRVGVLAALRSASLGGRATGVMVTASHNPAPDNGAKIVDSTGAMLAREWEEVATGFVNAADVAEAVRDLLGKVQVDVADFGKATVVVGGDTRPSTAELVGMVKAGVEAVSGSGEGNGRVVDIGTVTTPQLHFVVRSRDRGEPHQLTDYYDLMKAEYGLLCGNDDKTSETVCVDCANGVGAMAVEGIDGLFDSLLTVNRVGCGELNFKCGADFVQKQRVMPHVHRDFFRSGERISDGGSQLAEGALWASLDGDADRLVMYKSMAAAGESPAIALADGDRFSALTAAFLSEQLEGAGMSDVVIGVAQTAYSNGAATEFLEALRGVKVVIAKTGVKHLEIAIHPFDIGVYWEPNGHGTVLFSDKFACRIEEELKRCGTGDEHLPKRASLDALRSVGRLANQAVGDGVADLLLVLAILRRQNMSFGDWLGMYAERCSANLVVRVADKNVITTEDCDRTVTEPAGLRAAVEAEMKGGLGRRAFVRPSGTEDVVRVYAEAPAGSDEVAKDMALSIARAVYDTCGGVGTKL